MHTTTNCTPLTRTLLALDARLATAQSAVDRAYELVSGDFAYTASTYTSRAKRACAAVQKDADAMPFGGTTPKAVALSTQAARITADALYLETA